MGLFTKQKQKETGLIQLQNLISHSFKNVQRDTSYILHWLNFLYQKNQHQEQQIKQLREELNYTPKSKEDIRKIVDEFYSYEHLLNRIKELNERVEDLRKSHTNLQDSHSELHQELKQKHQEIGPKLNSIKEELRSELNSKLAETQVQTQVQAPQPEIQQLHQRLEKLEARKATIKEKIIKRITKNSKDYVKSIVLSYIKKYGKITALQLKDMVVEEQGLCSKSSFYRLLEELEEDPEIGVIKTGKEKHYIAKMTNKNY